MISLGLKIFQVVNGLICENLNSYCRLHIYRVWCCALVCCHGLGIMINAMEKMNSDDIGALWARMSSGMSYIGFHKVMRWMQ